MKQIKKTITKAEIAAMPKVLFPGRIFVIYTESEAEKSGSLFERPTHSGSGYGNTPFF